MSLDMDSPTPASAFWKVIAIGLLIFWYLIAAIGLFYGITAVLIKWVQFVGYMIGAF